MTSPEVVMFLLGLAQLLVDIMILSLLVGWKRYDISRGGGRDDDSMLS